MGKVSFLCLFVAGVDCSTPATISPWLRVVFNLIFFRHLPLHLPPQHGVCGCACGGLYQLPRQHRAMLTLGIRTHGPWVRGHGSDGCGAGARNEQLWAQATSQQGECTDITSTRKSRNEYIG